MADIRTITILPTQSVQQVQSNIGAGTQGTTALGNLSPGTVLSGFIINRDLAGNPVLRTDTGNDVTFSSNFFLNIGSEVSIRIENSVAGTLAHILSVNGQPPEVAAAQSAFGQEPEIIVGQNISAPAGQPQTAATIAAPQTTTLTVNGTLVAQPQQTSADAPPPLPTGTQLTLKVTGLTAAPASIPDEILNSSPQETAVPQAPTAPANPAFYSTYARAAGTPTPIPPTPPAPVVPVVTTDATQEIPTTANTAPLPQATTSAIPPSGQSVTATVVSNESSRETILQTPIGIIRLQPGTVLPAGSTVKLEITSTLPPLETNATEATSGASAPLTELAQQWTSLQQIVTLLAGRAGTSGFNVIQDTMPWVMPPPGLAMPPAAATQNIPTGLMLFMAALRGGDFRNWLGEANSKWLQDQGHDALIAKATSEFTLLARQFSEPQPGHWQALFFPIAVGGEVQQARIFVKRDRKQGNNQQGKKNDDTRFVVEVDLTQLGEMQMDGFVRRRDREVHFDLVIRSLIPLAKEIQQDILTIYNGTGELTGYKGSLSFQTVRDFPVNPMEEIAPHSGTVVV